jgi:hypothetical protein
VKAIEEADQSGPNPVTAARDLQLLRNSEEPGRQEAGEVLTAVAELRTELAALARRAGISRPDGEDMPTARDDFAIGDAVVHAKFGEGVVQGFEPGGVVVVRFAETGDERKLMASYAPLKRA